MKLASLTISAMHQPTLIKESKTKDSIEQFTTPCINIQCFWNFLFIEKINPKDMAHPCLITCRVVSSKRARVTKNTTQ